MRADLRRIEPLAGPALAELNRQLRQSCFDAVRERGLDQSAGGEMRIGPQILDRADWREGDAGALAAPLDFGAAELAERLADRRHEPFLRLDAVAIAREPRIGGEIRPLEHLAETSPQRITGRGDENVLLVGALEHLIDAPAGIA